MKRILHLVAILSIWQLGFGQRSQPQVKFHFASRQEASELILAEDDYTLGWNAFDIASRLQDVHGTKEQLLQKSAGETENWTDREMQTLNIIADTINSIAAREGYYLPCPERITVVKTRMTAESGAGGYTRGHWIAIESEMLAVAHTQRLEKMMAHELFHILTRNDRHFKQRMYATIGFMLTDHPLYFPPDLLAQRISNPDVIYDSYSLFEIDSRLQMCTMLLYTDRPYSGGAFFEYWNVGFVPLDENMLPVRQNGKTVIKTAREVAGFFEKVGQNTNYVIHPEEILADNFYLALKDSKDLKTESLKIKIQQVLSHER